MKSIYLDCIRRRIFKRYENGWKLICDIYDCKPIIRQSLAQASDSEIVLDLLSFKFTIDPKGNSDIQEIGLDGTVDISDLVPGQSKTLIYRYTQSSKQICVYHIITKSAVCNFVCLPGPPGPLEIPGGFQALALSQRFLESKYQAHKVLWVKKVLLVYRVRQGPVGIQRLLGLVGPQRSSRYPRTN